MADPSLVERLLDPAASPPPVEWLWPCLLGGVAVSVLGVVVIARLLRGLGAPAGSLPPSIGVMAIGLGLGALVLPAFLVSPTGQPLLHGAATLLVATAAVVALAFVQSTGPQATRPQWIQTDARAMSRAMLVWLVLVPTLLACILASVAGVRLGGGEITQQPQLEMATQGSGPLWIAGWYVAASLAAPLAEEVIFRLALYGALAGWLARGPGWRDPGRIVAACVSVGLFVAAHDYWIIGFAPLALLAWVLTALFAHSRSLWPCVLVHALHNTLVLTLQFFVLG